MQDTVCMIAHRHPETVFCGSFGLVLNGLLDRKVNDLDVITSENYWKWGGFFPDERRENHEGSQKFMVGKDTVLSFKVHLNGIKVDVLYNEGSKPEYTTADFGMMSIRVETPGSAIRAKKLYIVNDRSNESVVKHLKDLIYMGTDRGMLIDLIDRSCLAGSAPWRVTSSAVTQVDWDVDDLPF